MGRINLGSAISAFVLVALGSMASAQTVTVGAVSGLCGQTVSVPVTLTASTSHTAALIRVQYNSAVLENPAATAEPLMKPVHALDAYAPAAGRFNVALYAPSGMPSFTARSGTLFYLRFRIKATARSGSSIITFTTVGAPALPNAEIVTVAGASVAPIAGNGRVLVVATDARSAWSLYP